MLTALAESLRLAVAEVRSHHYAGGNRLDSDVEHARRNVWRVGVLEVVHAHRHESPCNERCQYVNAP